MQAVTGTSIALARGLSTRLAAIAAVLLLMPLCPTTAFAQTSRIIIKGVGAGTLGSRVGSTSLVGGGITIEPAALVEFFAEATWEVGHSYPADTQEAPSHTSYVSEPVAVIITNTPLEGIRSRINAVYFGGLRLITPPDRTVRTFVAVGLGLAQFKGTTVSDPDNLPRGYYTEGLSIWGVGGGGLEDTARSLGGRRRVPVVPSMVGGLGSTVPSCAGRPWHCVLTAATSTCDE